MSRIFSQEGGKDVLHVDEFPVKVIYVFYPEQFENPTLDTWSGPNPQVWQMKARKLMDSRRKDSKFEPAITEAKVKGLRMMSYAPPGYVRPPGPTGRYGQTEGVLIEPAGANYDLMMTCNLTIECLAFVQLKPSLVQYRFLMPTEAVNHASDVISTMNRMIEGWISKAKGS